jgi:hypothetical protein
VSFDTRSVLELNLAVGALRFYLDGRRPFREAWQGRFLVVGGWRAIVGPARLAVGVIKIVRSEPAPGGPRTAARGSGWHSLSFAYPRRFA